MSDENDLVENSCATGSASAEADGGPVIFEALAKPVAHSNAATGLARELSSADDSLSSVAEASNQR